jgi:hypothetical protein
LSSFFYVGNGKLELEELELENYFESFYKKRINHKDFQLSTALNLKKSDANENYSCVTEKNYLIFTLSIV